MYGIVTRLNRGWQGKLEDCSWKGRMLFVAPSFPNLRLFFRLLVAYGRGIPSSAITIAVYSSVYELIEQYDSTE